MKHYIIFSHCESASKSSVTAWISEPDSKERILHGLHFVYSLDRKKNFRCFIVKLSGRLGLEHFSLLLLNLYLTSLFFVMTQLYNHSVLINGHKNSHQR